MKGPKTWLPVAVMISVLGAALVLLGTTQSACKGDEKCLSDGENCSQAYLQANGKTDYYCCNGQSCQEGTVSGVLICRY